MALCHGIPGNIALITVNIYIILDALEWYIRYIAFINMNIARVEDECNIHVDECNISDIPRKKSNIIIIIHIQTTLYGTDRN